MGAPYIYDISHLRVKSTIDLRTRHLLRVCAVYGAKANYSHPDISVCRGEPQVREDLECALTRKPRRLTTVRPGTHYPHVT